MKQQIINKSDNALIILNIWNKQNTIQNNWQIHNKNKSMKTLINFTPPNRLLGHQQLQMYLPATINQEGSMELINIIY